MSKHARRGRGGRKKDVFSKAPNTAAALSKAGRPIITNSLATKIALIVLPAILAFAVYWPSLKSGLVYDARVEILTEGFITSLANLPAVLTFKVIGMNLMLGARPGHLLYLMTNAAMWGRDPWGYHLTSNLLHALNAGLLAWLLSRLVGAQMEKLDKAQSRKIQLGIAAVVLLFALHPIATETVASVSYSSDLLVTFFTLVALLSATGFKPERTRDALLLGGLGVVCAFSAVACKESGVAAALALVAYWIIFRRGERNAMWLLFLGASVFVAVAFLTARFLWAPPSQQPLGYLDGSPVQVFFIQPRIWAYMLGQLIWPVHLSADYTIQNVIVSLPVALLLLLAVLALQVWLARKSPLGALGVAIFWLGLAPVSNFVPLNCLTADRYYYLPLAGLAMQLLAVMAIAIQARKGFWFVLAPLVMALVPLTSLTLTREDVFASELSLWTDTLQASPFSARAYNGLGLVYDHQGLTDEAINQYERALQIAPGFFETHGNLAVAFGKKGMIGQAIEQFQQALLINPYFAPGHYNLGRIFLQNGHYDEAEVENRKAIEIDPYYAEAHNNLGVALAQTGRMSEAISEFQRSLEINPGYIEAHRNLGLAYGVKGSRDESVAEFEKVLQLNPQDSEAQANLAKAKVMALPIAGH